MTEGLVPWPGHWRPLGATPDAGGSNFALWSDGADAVDLCLFDDEGNETRYPLTESTFHVWHGYLPGVRAGQRYGFRVHGPWAPERGARFNHAKLLMDPYARAVSGEFVLNDAVYGHRVSGETQDLAARDDRDSAPYVPKSVVVQDDFDWGDDAPPRVPWADSVILETHLKGFTMLNPDVPEELRGTYAGMAHPAAIQHLVDLGITSVELMPVHHFVSEPHLLRSGRTNYWGYNSIAYFAPHADYAHAGSTGQQVTEFKALVKALHNAGIEVILDVVYNHTGEGGVDGPTLAFRGVDNDSFYRLATGGTYVDYTGCGNTLNVRQPHVLRLITDSLRYWVQEMHVDGFRFDLAAALARSMHDVDMLGGFLTTIEQDPILSEVKLVAEPWDVGSGGYSVGEFPSLWSEWNDKYRDTVRDFWRGADSGVRDLGYRLSGSSDLYGDDGRRPYASVNFVTAHDGFTLRDLVTYNHKHNQANGEGNRDGTDNNRSWNCGVEGETDDESVNTLRRRQMRNILTTLVLSTGVPMLVSGDEFGRTQLGNNNAYCQDNEISWLNWKLEDWQNDLLAWTQTLIDLRRKHPAFRQRHFFEGRPINDGGPKDLAWFNAHGAELDDEAWMSSETRTIAMYLSGDALRERGREGEPITDDTFLLVLNSADHDVVLTLPSAQWAEHWTRALDTKDERPRELRRKHSAGGRAHLAARSAALFRAS